MDTAITCRVFVLSEDFSLMGHLGVRQHLSM